MLKLIFKRILQALLEVMLHRVSLHSLSPHILEDRRYLDLAKVQNSFGLANHENNILNITATYKPDGLLPV